MHRDILCNRYRLLINSLMLVDYPKNEDNKTEIKINFFCLFRFIYKFCLLLFSIKTIKEYFK
jgi:hypothetical protein